MSRSSRLKEIRSYLAEKGQVSVAALCEIYDVSSVTIRKDLMRLEDEGFLHRTHGGAVLRDGILPPGFDDGQELPEMARRLEKLESLAEVASGYIRDGTWVYMSSGKTCNQLAQKILDRTLNVVTGGIHTVQTLSKGKNLSVFIPGGNLVVNAQNNLFLSGDWYLRALDDMYFDQSFVSISGISFETGYTVNNSIEILHIQKIKQRSKETIIIADSSKFGHQAFMSVASLDYANTIITNKDVPDEYREYFSKHGVTMLTD